MRPPGGQVLENMPDGGLRRRGLPLRRARSGQRDQIGSVYQIYSQAPGPVSILRHCWEDDYRVGCGVFRACPWGRPRFEGHGQQDGRDGVDDIGAGSPG